MYLLATQPCTLQQLVTECTDRLPAKQPCTVTSITGYSMYRPATGFTALYSSLNWLQCTGYTALYTGFNNWLQSVPAGTGYTACTLQQLVTVCTDRLPASQPYTVASTGYSVPATQPCTLASATGYRVYRLVLATQPCTLASATSYRVYRLVLATQPCTLASFYGLQVY